MPCLRGGGKYGYARSRGEMLLNRKETSAASKELGKADLQDGKEERILKRNREELLEEER